MTAGTAFAAFLTGVFNMSKNVAMTRKVDNVSNVIEKANGTVPKAINTVSDLAIVIDSKLDKIVADGQLHSNAVVDSIISRLDSLTSDMEVIKNERRNPPTN
jgi:U3 small nucleolar ribonucleoprotein component